mmetsp:Transcript_71628/g.191077  ORF Transcript_71628/g.191077 Transcript_71628/m.191077 type:complete len:325 (+) Transcript_71628:19-993(+)
MRGLEVTIYRSYWRACRYFDRNPGRRVLLTAWYADGDTSSKLISKAFRGEVYDPIRGSPSCHRLTAALRRRWPSVRGAEDCLDAVKFFREARQYASSFELDAAPVDGHDWRRGCRIVTSPAEIKAGTVLISHPMSEFGRCVALVAKWPSRLSRAKCRVVLLNQNADTVAASLAHEFLGEAPTQSVLHKSPEQAQAVIQGRVGFGFKAAGSKLSNRRLSARTKESMQSVASPRCLPSLAWTNKQLAQHLRDQECWAVNFPDEVLESIVFSKETGTDLWRSLMAAMGEDTAEIARVPGSAVEEYIWDVMAAREEWEDVTWEEEEYE